MQKQVEYSDAVKTKYPEQVVIAIAKDRQGRANPVTLGWTMIASGDPPMMAIAVAKKHYSIEAITHTYDKLASAYGIKLVHQAAASIDRDKRQVRLADGATMAYDRLVISPVRRYARAILSNCRRSPSLSARFPRSQYLF